MLNPISTFLFTSKGAFAIWMTKGFKGPFEKEMVSVSDRNSSKGMIRYFLGLGIWVAVFAIATVLLTRPTESKTFKVKMNDKGEIIEFEEVK
jgi:hypothetical protein